MKIGHRSLGPGHPVYLVAEIGINHNGDVEDAMELASMAQALGWDAVKLQKRAPRVCTPKSMWNVPRDTPWGTMSYIEYRERVELSAEDYRRFADHCEAIGIQWFLSVWDRPSITFAVGMGVQALKIPSAKLTDHPLLFAAASTELPLLVSTGMSTPMEVAHACGALQCGVYGARPVEYSLAHCTSTYPCPPQEVNLRAMALLPTEVVGYSGHEQGVAPTLAAVALGAHWVERHVTLDRTLWGSDQAGSLDPEGMLQLAEGVREVEAALGDGTKCVYDSELAARKKLRGE